MSAAWAAIVEHRDRFRAFVRRRVENDAAADEILQQGVLRALERGPVPDDGERAVRWFYRVLRNAVIDHYRARSAERRRTEALRGAESVDEPAALAPGEAPAACRCVTRLLPALRPAYASLLERIDLEGEATSEVAADLRVTPNNLMVRHHRARRALRASVERTCGACAQRGCFDCTCQ